MLQPVRCVERLGLGDVALEAASLRFDLVGAAEVVDGTALARSLGESGIQRIRFSRLEADLPVNCLVAGNPEVVSAARR